MASTRSAITIPSEPTPMEMAIATGSHHLPRHQLLDVPQRSGPSSDAQTLACRIGKRVTSTAALVGRAIVPVTGE